MSSGNRSRSSLCAYCSARNYPFGKIAMGFARQVTPRWLTRSASIRCERSSETCKPAIAHAAEPLGQIDFAISRPTVLAYNAARRPTHCRLDWQDNSRAGYFARFQMNSNVTPAGVRGFVKCISSAVMDVMIRR